MQDKISLVILCGKAKDTTVSLTKDHSNMSKVFSRANDRREDRVDSIDNDFGNHLVHCVA